MRISLYRVAPAFVDVVRHLADLDIEEMLGEATDREQWVIASDLFDDISIRSEHLE
jgi:hypothetical protein